MIIDIWTTDLVQLGFLCWRQHGQQMSGVAKAPDGTYSKDLVGCQYYVIY